MTKKMSLKLVCNSLLLETTTFFKISTSKLLNEVLVSLFQITLNIFRIKNLIKLLFSPSINLYFCHFLYFDDFFVVNIWHLSLSLLFFCCSISFLEMNRLFYSILTNKHDQDIKNVLFIYLLTLLTNGILYP